jgi:ribosome-associated heat shock protein Hsp15
MTDEQTARVDQWLWSVRVFKTRSAATQACRGGHVKVNRSPAKPATSLRVGDLVQVRAQQRERQLEVVQVIRRRVGAPIAAQCFVDHSPPAEQSTSSAGQFFERGRGAGRPTKQDRRAMDELRRRWSNL